MSYRHLTASLSVVALGLLIAACGDDGDEPPPSTEDGGLVDSGSPYEESAAPTDAGTRDAEPLPEGPKRGPLDRAGKAYVSALLVSPAGREAYNELPFDEVDPTQPLVAGGMSLEAELSAALVKLDALDGTTEWSNADPDAGASHPLASAFATADALLLDPNKPFSAAGYLDLEANGGGATTSGGRWLGDDALDKTMSYFVKKSLSGVSDNVGAPAKTPTQTFPYLAPPF